MQYISHYCSPLGNILLASDGTHLTGLWFEAQKYFAEKLDSDRKEMDSFVFQQTKSWLDMYFTGKEPGISLPIRLNGTAFQNQVRQILSSIPYGQTMTYGQIARVIAKQRGLSHMSAQAVGGAVGHNPISIIVPCHRVLGADGSLTGYAGGIERKIALLHLEGISHKESGSH